jgi:hypothetical protein
MPTAGKLAGAVVFAVVAWVVTELYARAIPPDQALGDYRSIAAFIGLVCGWRIMGPQADRALMVTLSAGLQTSLMTVVFSLLALSIYQMVIKSLRMLYDGPVAAVVGIFEMAVEYGLVLINGPVLLAIVLGGFIGGWISGIVGRNYP